MIRGWIERWIGHDRLLVAYEKLKHDNDKLEISRARLRERHSNLYATHEATVERTKAQRAELHKLQRLYTRALIELKWEQFLAANNDLGTNGCEKIRLMDHDQAWDVAELLTERFGKPMYAYACKKCPHNIITHDVWWHVTRQKNKRRK